MSGAIPDVDERELIRRRFRSETPFAVYFYTPLCGTCKLGEKMLLVVRAMSPEAAVVKANVNFMPAVVQDWKIESVPCLTFVDEKRIVEKLYTMRSVEFLLQRVRERLGT